jgi:plastocyanin
VGKAIPSCFSNAAAVLAAWMLLLDPARAAAATTNVVVGDNFFNPPNVTIGVNDEVQWNWGLRTANSHSTIHNGTPPLWNSGRRRSGVFTYLFTAAGVYPYYCDNHLGQVGNVTVRQTAQPPAISSPQRVAGQFRFTYSASVGGRYAVESSTNLLQWRAEATNTASTPTVSYTNAALHSAQFYRVLQLSEP